jgi:hypothetical protein
MTKAAQAIPESDLERTALDFTLSHFLSEEVRQSVLRFFEVKHKIIMNSDYPISREEISTVLEAFFGTGGNLIVDAFNTKLSELQKGKETIA